MMLVSSPTSSAMPASSRPRLRSTSSPPGFRSPTPQRCRRTRRRSKDTPGPQALSSRELAPGGPNGVDGDLEGPPGEVGQRPGVIGNAGDALVVHDQGGEGQQAV